MEAELNLDPDSNPDPELITDPDPNLQIISDPAGSSCTTLLDEIPITGLCGHGMHTVTTGLKYTYLLFKQIFVILAVALS